MPRISERQQSLSLLRNLLCHYYEADWLRRMMPFLPELYQHLLSKRYWATRDPVYKIGSWTPNLTSLRDDVSFQRDARMDKKTFFQLLSTIEGASVFNRGETPAHRQLLVSLQLSVFLAYLSSGGIGGSDFAISQRFGIGEGTVPKIIMRGTRTILDLVPVYIRWPSSRERLQIARRIESRSGFKGVCGIVDGTAFPLAFKPQHDPENYFHRKSVCFSAHFFVMTNGSSERFWLGFLVACMICGNSRLLQFINTPIATLEEINTCLVTQLMRYHPLLSVRISLVLQSDHETSAVSSICRLVAASVGEGWKSVV